MRWINRFGVAGMVGVALVLSGCGLGKKIEDVTNLAEESVQSTESVLRDALDSLERNSSDWQAIVQHAMDQLTSETQSTIRNELNNLMQRAVAATGAEFRCNADFIGDRVRQGIERILARITGQPVPAVVPGICNVIPLAIDRQLVPQRLNHVEFYGYDFDAPGVTATLFNRNGSRNISSFLDRPTHYHMTLNLGGNGVPLNDSSQRIVVQAGRTQLSSLAVIQAPKPVCQTKDETIARNTYLSLKPNHVRGDKDFHGHGPNVSASVRWINERTRVRVKLYMRAAETKKDWTTAVGSKLVDYYTPPPGWEVDTIIGGLVSNASYTDSDHSEDRIGAGPGGPAREFVFRGDHRGNDAGSYTSMDVYFNPLHIQLVQVGDCISPSAVKQLKQLKLISPSLLQHLRLQPLRVVPTQ